MRAGERFSFYGMRNILTPFLITTLLLFLPQGERASGAKEVFHTFVIGVYFFPLLGRLAVGPLLRQVQHHLLAQPRVRRGPCLPGAV